MVIAVQYLGQREIEAAFRARTSVHGGAETGLRRLSAIDDDDKRLAPAIGIERVRMVIAHKHSILHLYSVQVAGAHADEGEGLLRVFRFLDREAAVVLFLAFPEFRPWREQVFLPGMRAVVEAKQRFIVATFQAIGSGVLVFGPAFGQILNAAQLVINDRAFAHRGPHGHITAGNDHIEQRLQVVTLYDECLVGPGHECICLFWNTGCLTVFAIARHANSATRL